MNANWYSNLTTYWSKIEEETKQTLRLVRDDFQRGGMSLNSKFKEDFVQETNKRIAQTFDQFLNQNPINEMTAAVNRKDGVMVSQPAVESIPNGVHDPGNKSMGRIAVNTAELAHEFGRNPPFCPTLQTIDSLMNGNIALSDYIPIFPQGPFTSTPILGANPPLCPIFDSFMNESIGPNDEIPTIDGMLGNASKLTPQSDQSQAIDANEFETEGDANAFATENSNTAMPPDATGPAISRLDDIILMDVLEYESTEIDLPIDAIASEVMNLDIEQAASGTRDNESTNQLTECLVLNCEDEDVEPSLEITRDHIERNASEQGVGHQRRKRKIAGAMTSDGNARKRRKTGLRTTLKTIAESSSGDLALNGSCHQAGSTSSQPGENGGLDGASRQITSTSNVGQVAKKRGGIGRSLGEGGLKGHQCAFCEHVAPFESKLIIHTRKHTGDKPFKCEVCAKKFTLGHSLRDHMKIHEKEFSFHCRICLQGFNEEKAKKTHEMRCNRRRYECYLCKYSTLCKHALVKHMRKHTGEKPFCCSHCSVQFTRKSNLNRHLRRYHDETK